MTTAYTVIENALATQPSREEILRQVETYAADAYPEELDPPVWTPANLQDVEWALECIGESEAEIAAIDASLADAVKRLQERAAGIKRKAENRATFFRERIEPFAEANKDKILVGKKKSRELLAGTLAWRKKNAGGRLVVADKEAVQEWLKDAPHAVVRIKLEPEMSAIQEAFKLSGLIPPGFDYEPEVDELTIKANPLPTIDATPAKKVLP